MNMAEMLCFIRKLATASPFTHSLKQSLSIWTNRTDQINISVIKMLDVTVKWVATQYSRSF